MAAVTAKRIVESEVQAAGFSFEDVQSLATQAAPPHNKDLAKPPLASYAELRLRQGFRQGEKMFCVQARVANFDAAPQMCSV
jgi:hypothetical protein